MQEKAGKYVNTHGGKPAIREAFPCCTYYSNRPGESRGAGFTLCVLLPDIIICNRGQNKWLILPLTLTAIQPLKSHLLQFKKILFGSLVFYIRHCFWVERDTPSLFPFFTLVLDVNRNWNPLQNCSFYAVQTAFYSHTAVSFSFFKPSKSEGTLTCTHEEVSPQIPSLTANLSPLPPPPPSNHHCLATIRHTDTDLLPF